MQRIFFLSLITGLMQYMILFPHVGDYPAKKEVTHDVMIVHEQFQAFHWLKL